MNDASKVEDPNQEEKLFFFLSTLTVYYLRDEQPKQRTFNVLGTRDTPDLSRSSIDSFVQSGLARIKAENDVDTKMIQDAVIQNIVCLGHMTQAQFDRVPQPAAETTPVEEPAEGT